MNVTFSCPRCSASARIDLADDAQAVACPLCHAEINLPAGAWDQGHVSRCLVCPSTDLYVRKDFPQRVGVGLVALGVIGSSIAWAYSLPIWTFAILFATALLDVALYLVVPDALMCYRCHAQYRGVPGMDQHGAFNLETHERYRQQAARLARRPAEAVAKSS